MQTPLARPRCWRASWLPDKICGKPDGHRTHSLAGPVQLNYGSATVEMHTDAVKPGDRVLLIDDLIATGGTMLAGKKLLERLGAVVIEGAAIVDLPELQGSARLREAGLPLFKLVDFDGH